MCGHAGVDSSPGTNSSAATPPRVGRLAAPQVVAELRDEFTAITYARSAYQPSVRGSGPLTFAAEVEDLLAVVEAACDSPAHLVGGSYGATVALHAAVSAPAGWRSVTVFEPPLFAAGHRLRPILERHLGAVRNRRYATAAWLFGAEVARMPADIIGPEPDDATADLPADEADAALAAGCAADLEAMTADATAPERWGDIAAPVLLMQGELTGPPMPVTMAELRGSLPPSSEHVVLQGQSHFATHTAPRQFADELRAFVRRHPAS